MVSPQCFRFLGAGNRPKNKKGVAGFDRSIPAVEIDYAFDLLVLRVQPDKVFVCLAPVQATCVPNVFPDDFRRSERS